MEGSALLLTSVGRLWPSLPQPGRLPMQPAEAVVVALTEVGLATQLLPVTNHALAQQAFRLRVARILHLPSDLGYRVEHTQLGP